MADPGERDDDGETTRVVGRLAPSPTGVLHLGNARSFLLAWLSIRARGGRLRLRIEDIDGPRIKDGAEAAAIEDLAWLGLDWDGAVVRQSERKCVYRDIVTDLLERGLAYPCICSRREIAEASSAPHESEGEPAPYPGTCRDRFRTREDAKRVTGREPAVRFRVTRQTFPFEDLVRGEEPGRLCGDFVIEKRDRDPAYQLAVVVDDDWMGVTEVLRADDLVPSTPRQLHLIESLGLRVPRHAHVPLMVGADGLRLAKRHGDTSLGNYRAIGADPRAIVGFLAWSAGLVDRPSRLSPHELLPGFDMSRVARDPFVFRDDVDFS